VRNGCTRTEPSSDGCPPEHPDPRLGHDERDMVWRMIHEDLPRLRETVDGLLKSSGAPPNERTLGPGVSVSPAKPRHFHQRPLGADARKPLKSGQVVAKGESPEPHGVQGVPGSTLMEGSLKALKR